MRRLAPALLALALLTACGAGGSADSATSSAGDKAAVPAVAGEGSQVGDVGNTAKGTPAKQVTVTRAVTRTAALTVEVDDVTVAADRATTVATARGGHVQADNRDSGRASLVLRVPTEDVTTTLTALAKLGDEQSREVSEQDVTEQQVDLASRLATQRASVARVRALLDRAQSLSDITSLESELTRREADLESLQNRSAALADQVELATVNVVLVEGTTTQAAGSHGFLDGLRGGWDALKASARVVAVVLGAALPFVPLLLLALLVARVLRRRTAAAS